jgi:glycosyltransferase involved in cell wall biosynthesis
VGAQERIQPSRLPWNRAKNILRRYRYWKGVLDAIADQKLDLVLITSECYDPLFYIAQPQFAFGLFILNPRLYIYKPAEARGLIRGVLFSFYKRRYRQWAHGAAFTVTTNEPPMIPELEALLGIPRIPWLPNLYLPDAQHAASGAKKDAAYDFLTIGTISKSKSHLFALDTFAKLNLPYRYHVAGLARDQTGRDVEEKVNALQADPRFNISGLFGYIDDQAYVQRIQDTKFMLLPYDFARGNISSQVMHECFIHGVPIVAPAIQPFKWYVERYGIGILYAEGDSESLAQALKKALDMGPEAYTEGFAQLRADNSLASAKRTLSAHI